MVSIIKNQLLKHLSRYTKNLSSDKINLSTFRGEGELSNLQLDENVLTDLLELPSWLRLTSAWCNHVSFRISWTKLKSVPITLVLDEVNISIETCEEARNSGGPTSPTSSTSSSIQALSIAQGKYSFIHKVVDGITVIVNTVNVKFKSQAFTASVQMSRIRVESKTPKWLHSNDLRITRLKDPQKGIVLIFKEVSWQTVRIEASSTQDTTLTPLRLLTNQARCRITIRKRLSDCSVLASRLVIILDDLLWVLTDSQLKAALHFVDSLSGLIKAATNATQKTKAQKKLETLPEYQALIAQQQSRQLGVNPTSPAQKNFNAFDVRETSYHFFSQRIDLHLCDDEGAEGRSSHPELRNGGALQISVQAFQVDYYPYHLAKSDRSHWAKYKEANIPPALWLEQSLNVFREAVLNLSQPNRPPTHAPLERTPVSPLSQSNYQQSPINSGQMTPSGTGATNSQRSSISSTAAALAAATTNKTILDNMAKLMSACVVIRIEDFTLYRVTTAGKKQMPKEFIAGDKDKYSMPAEMPIIHAEFTYFYYPGDFIFPLPPSKIFVYINPIQIHFDLCSILWFNSFALNLHESLLKTNVVNESKQQQSPSSIKNEPSFMYMDVKLEVIMPRVIIESSIEPIPAQKDRPKQMQIQIARFALTNIREMGSSRADLAQALHSLQEGSLVFGTGFPSVEGDLCIVTDRILSHVAASDVPNIQSAVGIDDVTTAFNSANLNTNTTINNLTRYAMWSEPRDVWCIKFDPIWIDFIGARSVGQNKSIPFIDAVPITIWIHESSSLQSENNLNSKEQQQQQQYQQDKTIPRTINPLDFANSNNIHSSNSNSNSNFSSQCSINTTIDNKQNYTILNSKDIQEEISNLHAIAHVSNLVSVQIDHYQYLFLLRLSEELQELTTFLSLDAERISQMEKSKKSIIFGCVIPQIEVTVVMPSPTPGKESSGGDAESVLPDSASLMSTNITWPTPPPLDHMKNLNINSFGNIETPSTPITANATSTTATGFSIQQQQQFDEFISSYSSNPNTQGHNVQIQNNPIPVSNKDQMQSSLYSQGQSSSSTTGIVSAMSTSITTASSSVSSRGGGGSGSANKSRNSVTDSAISKEINMGLLSMKKGFTSFMTSIDSALKTGTSGLDDVSDTFSIYSDISSDSENYAIVMADDKTADCMDVMFRLNPFTTDTNLKVSPVEVASEVCEEPNYKTNMSSPSEPSEGSTWRRRDLVSMATFRLTTVEVIRQNQGYSSSLRLQVSALSCDECGAIPWDELQTAHQQPEKTKFEARCRAWNIASYNPEAPPCIKLRLEETLNPPENLCNLTEIDKNVLKSWFEHDIDIRAKDLTLDLTMSTAIGLGDFSEDEIIAKPLPLKILLENVKLNLIEDRPPVNITSPGPVPINLSIGKMIMKRDTDGIVHIQPLDNDNDDTTTTFSKKTTSDIKNIVESSKNSTINIGEYKKEKLHRNKDRDKEILSLQLIMQQLKLENDNLKKQLNTTNETSENYRIKIKQENEVLRTYLKAAQDDISTLLDEKRTLLDSIRLLQQQLTAVELNKKHDGNR